MSYIFGNLGNVMSLRSNSKPDPIYPQDPLEAHYTVQEISKEWKVDAETVRNVFIDEPGVLEFGRNNRRDGKRNYVILRIPASVLQRVYERRTQRKFSTPADRITITRQRAGRLDSQAHSQRALTAPERKD